MGHRRARFRCQSQPDALIVCFPLRLLRDWRLDETLYTVRVLPCEAMI